MPIEITNLKNLPRDAFAPRRMTAAALVQRWNETILGFIQDALNGELAGSLPPDASSLAAAALDDFIELYDQRPVQDNSGGSGFNDSLWIYLMARLLRPAAIVESGVHKGHSTWLFRQACPEAVILCFDVTFKNIVYHDEKARYFELDWMSEAASGIDAGPLGQDSLIFFDDHISQALRLEQAQARGFRRALFDDNFPVTQLYATGGPPVPTLAMVTDRALTRDCEIEWTRNGKLYRYPYRSDSVAAARAALAGYHVLPDLAPLTRYPAGSGLTFVEIAQIPQK